MTEETPQRAVAWPPRRWQETRKKPISAATSTPPATGPATGKRRSRTSNMRSACPRPMTRRTAPPAFFLAMAYWQVADKTKAREWFDKSVAWMEQGKQKDDADLKRFRAEAAELLGIKEKR